MTGENQGGVLALPGRALAMAESMAAASRPIPLTEAERAEWLALRKPLPPYKLTGDTPDPKFRDVNAVVKILAARHVALSLQPGLVIQTHPQNDLDRWYITFRLSGFGKHRFFEASGKGQLFREHEFAEFLDALDQPPTKPTPFRPVII